MTTAGELFESRNLRPGNCFFRSTPLPSLNGYLKGGFICGTISEIVGPPGVGKSQFCLSTAVDTILCDSSAGVVYIDTEGAFSATRLCEIYKQRCLLYGLDPCDEELRQKMLSVVKVCHVDNCDDFLRLINQLEEGIISLNAKTIIVDSIASLVKKEFDTNTMINRTLFLSKTASVLKYLAESFDIPVIVTNQIAGHAGSSTALEGITFLRTHSEETSKAALGNTWAHCVNTRVALSFIASSSASSDNQLAPDTCRERKRYLLSVAKSPICAQVTVLYGIDAEAFMKPPEDKQANL